MRPNDDQIAAAKVAAAKVDRRAMLLDLAPEFDLAMLLRDLTAEEFAEWLDLVAKDKLAATSLLLARCLLWPTLDEARAVMPAASEKVYELALERAGVTNDKALVEIATVDRMIAEGVPADTAAAAAAQNPGTALSLFRMPVQGVKAVLARPSADSFDATREAETQANRDGVGRYAVALHAVTDVLVWSPEPLEKMLDRAPGVLVDLKREYLRLGGAATKGSLKSL